MKELAKKEIDATNNSFFLELQKNSFKLELVKKIAEVDRNYKQRVFSYKKNIQTYNTEIEKLKNKIAIAIESCNVEEKKLLRIEHELVFENKVYDSLQIKFSTHVDLIKENELSILLDDIEVVELSLLNKELLRLNMLEIIEPKEEVLKSLEIALKDLEMDKANFESIGLDFELENKSFLNQENSDIVDTVEVDI